MTILRSKRKACSANRSQPTSKGEPSAPATLLAAEQSVEPTSASPTKLSSEYWATYGSGHTKCPRRLSDEEISARFAERAAAYRSKFGKDLPETASLH